MKVFDKVEKYRYRSNRDTYYKVNQDMTVVSYEPTFILELAYFSYAFNLKKIDKLIEKSLLEIRAEKEKPIKRRTKIKKEILNEKLFKMLVNRRKENTVEYACELYLKDKSLLFDILYKLSFLSEDENKLIKTYLFEYICNNFSYDEFLLRNLAKYFISSCPKYMDYSNEKQLKYFSENRSSLYSYIYNKKIDLVKKYNLKELKFKKTNEDNEIKKIILDLLKKGETK